MLETLLLVCVNFVEFVDLLCTFRDVEFFPTYIWSYVNEDKKIFKKIKHLRI